MSYLYFITSNSYKYWMRREFCPPCITQNLPFMTWQTASRPNFFSMFWLELKYGMKRFWAAILTFIKIEMLNAFLGFFMSLMIFDFLVTILFPAGRKKMTLVGSSLISPETPRPKKPYILHYQNGTAYTYLGFKCSTSVFFCSIHKVSLCLHSLVGYK